MKTEKSLSLFSEETLDSVVMTALVGGDATNDCHGGNCAENCKCTIVSSNVVVSGRCTIQKYDR